jgi:hypothetical protein
MLTLLMPYDREERVGRFMHIDILHAMNLLEIRINASLHSKCN